MPDDFDDEVVDYGNTLFHDPEEAKAYETIKQFFATNREAVFYSRLVEVLHEKEYFYWITNRVLRELVKHKEIRSERS